MTNITIVTSFNEKILKDSAHYMLDTLSKNLEPSVNLVCYHHDCNLDNYSVPSNSNITYKNLHDVTEHEEFLSKYSKHNGTENNTIPYNIQLDGVRFSHKVFALTEEAFTLADKSVKPGWIVWIDADSYFKKRITKKDILAKLNKESDLAFIENDASFMAFNLNKQPPIDLLGDLRGAYISGEFVQYREWHDYFILQRLINIYQVHGLKLHKIPSVSEYMIHFKGQFNPNKLASVRDSKGKRVFELPNTVSPDIKPNRYKQLADIIRHYKPKSIIETGTWNAGRAIEMALASFENQDELLYRGFDLFEDATTETDVEENNVKAHNTRSAVIKRLQDFRSKMMEKKKVFTFQIGKGNTRDILKDRDDLNADLILLGGGNSIKTVDSEYENVKHNPLIIFDHYITKDEKGNILPKEFQGVNKVFKNIKVKKTDTRKHVLPSGDVVLGGGHTHLAVVLHDKKLPDLSPSLKSVPIIVNPRDCVPKDYIRTNIKNNMKLIKNDKWIDKCVQHDGKVILVSAGPCIDYEELKFTIRNNPNAKVMCVKHSYPKLLENGIVPWGCVVLDPRHIDGVSTHGIVRKELFHKIEKKTKFFVASMTDPSVTNYLIDNNADIHGWHAFTESLREETERSQGIHNNQVKVLDELNLPEGATLITGGTCAAMRTIGIMHTMGFRNIELFGFDCSLKDEPTKKMMKETTGAEDEEARPKYFKVGVGEKFYWTTGELLAMAQDCEKVFSDTSMGILYTFHGENTLVSDLWNLSEGKQKFKNFKEMFND
jgi:hypothetical protein|tara:strand:+ start:1500 stop:3815 length:2316 start_codon:yes stop_codon:yes gene_type:complete